MGVAEQERIPPDPTRMGDIILLRVWGIKIVRRKGDLREVGGNLKEQLLRPLQSPIQ